METRFNSADKDGSGTISSEERKAAREAMREQRSERGGERPNRR